MRGKRQSSDRAQSFDRVQHIYRTNTAVATDHIGAPLLQFSSKGLRIRAVPAIAIFVDGYLGDHGQFRIYLSSRQNCLVKFFQIADRLQDEQIDSALGESTDLLMKRFTRFLKRNFAQRFNPDSQRAHRSRNPPVETFRRLMRQTRAGKVNVVNLIGKGMASQAEAVCAKRVGFNDFSSSLKVFVMDVADQIGLREVQFVIAPIDEYPFGVQQRTHGPVAQDGRLLKPFEQVPSHCHSEYQEESCFGTPRHTDRRLQRKNLLCYNLVLRI